MTYLGGLYTGGGLHVLNVRVDGIEIHAECSGCKWRRDRVVHSVQSNAEVRRMIEQEFEGHHSFQNRVRITREEARKSAGNPQTEHS